MSTNKIEKDYMRSVDRVMRPFNLLSILRKDTDINNSIDVKSLKKILNSVYFDNVSKPDTVINYMSALVSYFDDDRIDSDIIIRDLFEDGESDKHEYYCEDIGLTDGELSAIYLLLLKSRSLNESHSEELLNKLTLQIKKRRLNTIEKALSDVDIDDGQLRTKNRLVILNLEMISEAINLDRNIAFDYCKYNMSKELVIKEPKCPYEVKPLAHISSNGKLYLVAYHKHYNEERIYRVDKIKNICIEDDLVIDVDMKTLNRSSKNITMMHADESIAVRIRCEKRILGNVIEQFEEAVLSVDQDNTDYFFADIPDTSFMGIKNWILQFSSSCEVLLPLELRESVKCTLNDALKKYIKE